MMRKYILVLLIFASIFLFSSCATIDVPDGVGDGSDSGYVYENLAMVDGTIQDMHLFKTYDEYQAFFQECASGKWFQKHELTTAETFKTFGKNAKFVYDDFIIVTMPLEDFGEIGNVMFQKGLPLAVAISVKGNEVRQYAIAIQKGWKTARYSQIDFIDEKTYDAKKEKQLRPTIPQQTKDCRVYHYTKVIRGSYEYVPERYGNMSLGEGASIVQTKGYEKEPDRVIMYCPVYGNKCPYGCPYYVN